MYTLLNTVPGRGFFYLFIVEFICITNLVELLKGRNSLGFKQLVTANLIGNIYKDYIEAIFNVVFEFWMKEN